MQKIYYSPDDFLKDGKRLAKMVKNFSPDILIPILRGGMTLCHYMAEILNIRDIRCLSSISYDDTKKLDKVEITHIPTLPQNTKILVVDDICDSGDTLSQVINTLKEKNTTCEFKTATLFYKKTATFTPDYTLHEAKEWIEFFWSKY